MSLLWILCGTLCVAYTAMELARAARPPAARFGAVDARTGQPVPVTCDRRRRERRAPSALDAAPLRRI